MVWSRTIWPRACWVRLRRHRWVLLAYRHWPHDVVDICLACGRTRRRYER